MYDHALPEGQRRALLALRPAAARGFYLAGGSALCLRLGHRRSVDLDLFRDCDFDAEQLLRELLFQYPNLRAPEAGIGVPVASLEESLR